MDVKKEVLDLEKKVKDSGCKGNKNFEITIITNSFC